MKEFIQYEKRSYLSPWSNFHRLFVSVAVQNGIGNESFGVLSSQDPAIFFQFQPLVLNEAGHAHPQRFEAGTVAHQVLYPARSCAQVHPKGWHKSTNFGLKRTFNVKYEMVLRTGSKQLALTIISQNRGSQNKGCASSEGCRISKKGSPNFDKKIY